MIVNVLGAVMLIAGLVPAFLVGWIVDEIWPNANRGVAVGGMVCFVVAATSDLVYRWRHFRERGLIRFVHPFTGGMFFFIPIWALFVAPLVAMPIVMIFNPPKKIPPPRVALAPAHHLEESWNTVSSAKPASPFPFSVRAARRSDSSSGRCRRRRPLTPFTPPSTPA